MSQMKDLSSQAAELKKALSTIVLGQEKVIDQLIVTVLCQGHALLTGAPGVAKTTLVRNLARALGCGYNRIQFTPDLTPFDILGGETIRYDKNNPELKRLEFRPGPIFTPFILADEINRASPRTQSALLEAMQEKQVSHSGETRKLPHPFYVFATQNPIESDGTFPLPDAQLDRFLVNIEVPYPSFQNEIHVATLPQSRADLGVIDGIDILFNARELVESVPLPKTLLEGVVRLVRNTRPESSDLSIARQYFDYGASPRATQALTVASKAYALLSGEQEVSPAHILATGPAVLRHRCVLNFKAVSDRRNSDSIIEEILSETVF